ncbi:MAG: hypothetical protein XD37_1498 [Thermoanaerobacter thermocopriae]|jgi:hypothetical protein|nr:MAG: hypothetical protein XD37_1498 [Thermoanaerobacter thermocopriae]
MSSPSPEVLDLMIGDSESEETTANSFYGTSKEDYMDK